MQVKSKQMVPVWVFLGVWGFSLVGFWTGGSSGGFAMAYGLLVLYGILPVTLLGTSIALGAGRDLGRGRWGFAALFSALYALLPWLTYSLANTLATGRLNALDLTLLPVGLAIAGAGCALGSLIRLVTIRFMD